MRIFLPERIRLSHAFLFASALFLLQQLEHTSLYFSACSFLFVLVATFGFNIAGGLTRPSGGYLFFFSTLALLVGLCTKAVLGEPADSHLLRPHVTITVYLVGICSMTLSVLVVRKLSRSRPLLESFVTDRNMYQAAVGCLAIGIVLTLATHLLTRASGSVLSALFQINRFTELSIILGVIASLRRSGGRRSVDAVVLAGGLTLFIVNGLLSYSKEGFFGPLACWGVAAASANIRLRRNQIIIGGLLVGFITYFMVPYSQYGRVYTAPTLSENLVVAERLLSNLGQVRQQYEANSKQSAAESSVGDYYDHPEGVLDRFEMISVDDQLIDVTINRGTIGYFPLAEDVESLVPHVFWPNKPKVLWGNVYAHEAGVHIPEDDFTTGISFSPLGEAYHLGGWIGLIFVAPLIWIIALLIFDSLCGDVRRSPWGLLVLVYFAHIAPEAYLAGIIYASVYISFAIAFAAVTTGYLMPIIGQLLVGPGRSLHHSNPKPLVVHVRQRPLPPQETPHPRYTEGT